MSSRAIPTIAACPGFTLTEVMIATTISVLVLAGTVIAFQSQTEEYRRQQNLIELQQNAASAAARVIRDIRMAGYGLPVPASQVSNWVTWVSGTTNAIRVMNGTGSAPDRLRLVGAFDAPCATLQVAINAGGTVLQLQPGQAGSFDTTISKLVYVDRQELARVVSIAGNHLTISTHVTLNGRGFRYPHPVGAPIELVQVVEYACMTNWNNSLRRPYLYRDDNRGVLTNALQKLTTLGIEDVQVAYASNRVNVTFSALAQSAEYRYRHPVAGDAYRRISLTVTAEPRNPVN